MVLARMASYGCAQWGVAAQWLSRCCPDAAPRPLQLVESYDTSSPMLVEALRRHDAASRRSQGRWMLPRAREALQTGQVSWERVFPKQQSPTQRKGGEAPGGLEGAVAELFFRPENAPLRGEACCPVPRRALLETRVGTNRRTTAHLLRALQLQGLPLRTSSTAPGLPLVNYSSVNAVAARA